MRCSCRICGEYMVQSEDMTLGCICPNCSNRCTDCLGMNTKVFTLDEIRKMDPSGDPELPGD